MLRTLATSHSLESGWMRSLTFHRLVARVGGPIDATGSEVESHGSVHRSTSWPDPRAQPNPFNSRSLPISSPRHPCDELDGCWTSKKGECKQYFPSRVLAMREFGFFKIHQESFANKASLNWLISRKPRPPALFGLVRDCQEIQQIFLTSGEASHQNLVRIDCNCLTRDIGNLKHDIVYVGIAASTNLSKTIFSAPDRYLDVQLCDLCLIRSTNAANISRFFRPKCSGKLRYFPNPPTLRIWIC